MEGHQTEQSMMGGLLMRCPEGQARGREWGRERGRGFEMRRKSGMTKALLHTSSSPRAATQVSSSESDKTLIRMT